MKSLPVRSKEVVTFHSFARKGYALFSALQKEVRIGVLSAATLTTATPCLAHALSHPATFDAAVCDSLIAGDASLKEALVSASRAPMAAQVAARQVISLTKEDLQSAGVTTVNDVLKLAVGIDVRQRGGFGLQTDISIDGGTFDQITLLVNGISINNPQTGHNAADFPLNLADIERIEILEGAASRLFGSQAFSGAINIITRTGGDKLRLALSGGSYAYLAAEGRSALQGEKWATSLSGSFQRSDGAVRNGDFKGGKFFWQGRYEDAAVRADVQAGTTFNDFGANTFYSGAFPNQWEATRRHFVSATMSTKGQLHLAPSVSWLRNYDHFQLIRHTHKYENFNRGDVYTVGINAWTQWRLGRTAFGAELRHEELFSTNLGRPMDSLRFFSVPGYDNIYYTKHDNRTNISFFAEHSLVFKHWTLSAGLLAQRNSGIGRLLKLYPGVDLSYRPAEGWQLFASWNKSLRLPTFTDLYYKSPTQEGNIGLQAEEINAFRLGGSYTAAAFQVDLRAFYNRGANMIDWVMFSATDKFHATNFRLDNFGFNCRLLFNAAELFGPRQPLQQFSIAYAHIHQNRKDDQAYFKSNYAMEYLRHQFIVQLRHRIFGPLSADWNFRLTNRIGQYLVYRQAKSTGILQPYGTQGVLDCKISWKGKHYDVFVDLSNLTATHYYDVGNVEQPGFLFRIGAVWRL